MSREQGNGLDEAVARACEVDRDARVEWDSGRRVEAIDMLKTALSISPETSIALRLARYLQESGSSDEALLAAGYAYGRNPRRNEVAYEFAELLYKAGGTVRGLEIVEEILERCPEEPRAKKLQKQWGAKS